MFECYAKIILSLWTHFPILSYFISKVFLSWYFWTEQKIKLKYQNYVWMLCKYNSPTEDTFSTFPFHLIVELCFYGWNSVSWLKLLLIVPHANTTRITNLIYLEIYSRFYWIMSNSNQYMWGYWWLNCDYDSKIAVKCLRTQITN